MLLLLEHFAQIDMFRDNCSIRESETTAKKKRISASVHHYLSGTHSLENNDLRKEKTGRKQEETLASGTSLFEWRDPSQPLKEYGD